MTYDPRDSQHGVPLFIPLVASGLTGFMLVVSLTFALFG